MAEDRMTTYRVLALDGGGIRGLVTAILLKRLHQASPGLFDSVDLIAGTSSGGMIALALAHGLGPQGERDDGKTNRVLDEIIATFRNGAATFGLALPFPIGFLLFSKYQSSARAATFKAWFGAGTRLRELKRNVLIAAFDLDNGHADRHRRMWKPKLFHNYPGENSDENELAWEVAMKTSSAPVLFPSFNGYIDGGVYSNNPAMCALAQVFDPRYVALTTRRPADHRPRNPRLEEIRLLSIGAGLNPNFLPKPTYRGGALLWANSYVAITMDGTVGIADYQCERLLGMNYRRIEPVLDPDHRVGIDDVGKVDYLADFAHAVANTPEFAAHVQWVRESWLVDDRRADDANRLETHMATPAKPAPAASPTTAERIAQAFIAKVKNRKGTEPGLQDMPRGAHPRDHGLVAATFTVKADIPADLRRGVFERLGHPYPAYIRFSNAGTDPHDGDPDARGMAIKLMDVQGEKLLEAVVAENERNTQDFLLTSYPAFIAKTPEDFLAFMAFRRNLQEAHAKQSPELPALLKQFNERFPNVEKSRIVIRNPLTIPYFSQTPYRLGTDLVVKHCAVPLASDGLPPLSAAEARLLGPTYLRDAMRTRLAQPEDVVFEFKVQRHRPGMSIEDSTVPWSEQESEFVAVARIVIPPQEFTSGERAELAEHISYSPWHGLPAHRPLGQVNEVRRYVYIESAKFRHAANGVAYQEPPPPGAPLTR